MKSHSNFHGLQSMIVKVRAGKGGNGAVSFLRFGLRRTSNGGDGGRGGNVVIQYKKDIETVQKMTPFAADGKSGRQNGCKGADGEDTYIYLPPETIVSEKVGENCWKDINLILKKVICKGGNGGSGNKLLGKGLSSYGQEGQSKELMLVFKKRIDVCVIGFVGSGKSTLIKSLCNEFYSSLEYGKIGMMKMGGKCIKFIELPGAQSIAELFEQIASSKEVAKHIVITVDSALKECEYILQSIKNHQSTNESSIIFVLTKTDKRIEPYPVIQSGPVVPISCRSGYNIGTVGNLLLSKFNE